MTMVRPCRLITRQRSHIGLTDARTFKLGSLLLVAVNDPAAREVVRRKLHLDAIAREDADVVLAHLPRDLRENIVADVRLHPEHRARQRLDDLAFDLDFLFLDRHSPPDGAVPRDRTTQRTRRRIGARRATIVAKAPFPTSGSEAPARSLQRCARS